ncbi:major facilitator superfamily protein [Candidatus Planktophila dulcis]|uniref:Major facilitator superfamily protein n=1 Tax=Candidatus Planktophila dulcis TaxID=1884914 RepID=A0AAC9YT32_9ACTN|nr:MFS transporter [Candidatus Planktophila dulcis]ASY11709.1 major facilitator superfamily protein [Candidatus Planktophila dulcis]ASY14297.1 major facilitator superfamily protein [Candidatus Planktophila dulcis]ASY20959.1 major facilitator superfamily protein [Candidatus Planktophila dulcis]
MLYKEFTVLLNPQSRKIIFGICLNAIGGGMTLSLLLVYLHDMRGFTNTFGGLLLAYGSLVSIIASSPMGALVDRIGPKKVMIGGLLLNSAAAFSLSQVQTHFQAVIVITGLNIAGQAIWPSQSVILTRVTPERDRPKIFGFNFMLLNLGLGVGGLLSSLIIQRGDLLSFQIMYWVDACTFLLYLLIVLTLRGEHVNKYIPKEHEPKTGSYKDLFEIKPLMFLGIAGIILFTFGYGTIQAGIPVFATQFLGLSPKWLGIIFGVNTLSIVIFQPLVMRVIDKYSKYAALIAVGLVWALSWVFVGIAPYLPLFASGIALSLSQFIFAVGEMIQAPTIPTLANELAPEHIRGRANAWMSLQWSVSGVLGPAITGLMLGADLATAWIITMFIGCFLSIPLFLAMKRAAAVAL